MKNKTITYFLLIFSIGLWGFIVWRVYSFFSFSQPKIPTIKKEIHIINEDTISLLLNYRDPFLDRYTPNIVQKDSLPIKKSPSIPNQSSDLPNMQFKGMINVEKKSMAIIQRNGKVLSIKVGDEIDGFKLIKINEKKIILSRGHKKHEIFIQ